MEGDIVADGVMHVRADAAPLVEKPLAVKKAMCDCNLQKFMNKAMHAMRGPRAVPTA